MSLNPDRLITDIKAALEKAKDTPLAEDETPEQVQAKIVQSLAEDLAAAIATFVSQADVVGVTTDVTVDPGTGLGQGLQTGHGRLE